MNYVIEVKKTTGRLLKLSKTLKDAIAYANSFKDNHKIEYIEVTSIVNNEVLFRIDRQFSGEIK